MRGSPSGPNATAQLQKTVDLGTVSANFTNWYDVTGDDVTAMGNLATDALIANPTNGLMSGLAITACYVQDVDTIRIGLLNTTASPIAVGDTPLLFTRIRP